MTDQFYHSQHSSFRNAVDLATKRKKCQIIEINEASQFVIIQLPENMNDLKLGIFTVHFDVWSEDTRLKQLDILSETIAKYNDNICLLMMGDFNALKRMDYDDEKWEEIYQIRSKNYWELPKTDLLDTIENKYEFKDCLYLQSAENNAQPRRSTQKA